MESLRIFLSVQSASYKHVENGLPTFMVFMPHYPVPLLIPLLTFPAAKHHQKLQD